MAFLPCHFFFWLVYIVSACKNLWFHFLSLNSQINNKIITIDIYNLVTMDYGPDTVWRASMNPLNPPTTPMRELLLGLYFVNEKIKHREIK
jgi:hypothetical protein